MIETHIMKSKKQRKIQEKLKHQRHNDELNNIERLNNQ